MGLILQGNEAVFSMETLYAGRFPIGVVTSAANSSLLHKQIAMCRLAPQYATVGTELEVG